MKPAWLLFGAAASASAAITIDKLYPDWDYTTARLLPTTSDACRTAFRAPIDCDETLLGLAASMRTVFKPTPADFDRTCTATCKTSVDNYIEGLMVHCNSPGDLTQVHTDGPRPGDLVPIEPERVWVVGWVLQYILARSCRLEGGNPSEYCYFSKSRGSANNKFDCADSCNLQLYTIMHSYPGFHWFFNYYALKKQSSWWEGYSGPGWERAVQCGAKEEVPKHAKPPKAAEVYGGIKTTATGSASGVSSQASATGAGAGSGTAPSSGAPGAAVSDVARSRAGRLSSPFALFW